MNYAPVAVVPHYRHETTIVDVVEDLQAIGLDCLVVDDGSGRVAEAALQELERRPQVTVIFRETNGGKGAAMIDGMRWALEAGYTHALQIDADRQHDFSDIPRFLAASAAARDALICAQPVYGKDAPRARVYGRRLNNFFIWVHTGSREIPDGMCGFRIYPLAATMNIMAAANIGRRMDFDTEILVRMYWARIPMRWFATKVSYSADGVSHFRMLKDNWHISTMHARLLFASLMRRLRR